MGFFSDFLTWLKGRNLCPSLMNDKQELEKLGEYEEENGLIGQLYQHKVIVDVNGENNAFQFFYYAVNNIPDKYAVISTGSNIQVPEFHNALISQGFTYDHGSDQNGYVLTAWTAYSYESDENVYTWNMSALARESTSTANLSVSGWSVISSEVGQSVAIHETVTPFNPR